MYRFTSDSHYMVKLYFVAIGDGIKRSLLLTVKNLSFS